jgi:hypothetical protein
VWFGEVRDGELDPATRGPWMRAEEILDIRFLYSSEASVRWRSYAKRCAFWAVWASEVSSAVREV